MKSCLVALCFLLVFHVKVLCEERKVYVAYLGEHSGNRNPEEIEDQHHSYLRSVKGSQEEAKASHIYSYKNVINGFSALLTPEEASKLSEMDGVISVFRSEARELRPQTTRSWDFTYLLEANGDPSRVSGDALLKRANYGKDVIVGVFDSGIWPESQSFSDAGMGPIPSSWKGKCEAGVAFTSSNCNRKLIGARYYAKEYEALYGPVNSQVDYRSARDKDGHGTHTASTVGGRRVANISSIGGFANGTVTGGAPLVRLAAYKVCWKLPNETSKDACYDASIIKAFDDAIQDGVQVISVSIGGDRGSPYASDGIAIGSLHASKNNIVVACSAGNNGRNGSSTVTNIAPWLITVGASSIDRMFPSTIVLGNGLNIQGQTITPFSQMRNQPLVYAGDVEVPGTTSSSTRGYCFNGTLSPSLVRGKVVICLFGGVSQSAEVRRAGGVAAVLGKPPTDIFQVEPLLHPGLTITYADVNNAVSYTRTSRNPTVTLNPGTTVVNVSPAPFMAVFTSLGPNGIEPNILKPDITAPGLNILAAWSEASPPTSSPYDNRIVKYNIVSGTSMSCPHVSAVAALIKAIHPDWSSAAIRSAIMTTARTTNNVGNPITDARGNVANPFHYGSGHFQPSKAADPGLVYNATYNDYLLFLCYARSRLVSNCPNVVPSPSNLNYPSLAIANLNRPITVRRSVTNVGAANSTYQVKIEQPLGYSVNIFPSTLRFSQIGEIKSFNITVQATNTAQRNVFTFGSFTWSDGVHLVRSPIAVSSS
ncbi:subtilisin-like protease SBT5.6 [Coffea arabica]|uniref:Subtilisin-like protease SBT5.6 n=1 Tax=Coffea arabica TaxID=13443 RepID=A0A6P6UA10_COFAR|nr:subtilisin-like protease SBT5.6 [Coffea arabica]